jgi:hypothetical protein
MISIILKDTKMNVKQQRYWEIVRKELVAIGIVGVSLVSNEEYKNSIYFQ